MNGGGAAPGRDLAEFAALLDGLTDQRPGGADVMVVVAHPDDETIGVGGQLRRLRLATVVHVTDGAPRDGRDAAAYGFASVAAYAAARRRELEEAMAEAGVEAGQLVALGVPDKEAALNLVSIARALARLFEERQPRFVLTHPFEGGHPDHDATALAVWAACRLIKEAARPAVIEMTSYHLGPDGPVWGDFDAAGGDRVLTVALDEETRMRKRRMLAAHRSQSRTLAPFGVDVERFRAPPAHDFAALPNGGRLLNTLGSLGVEGADWPSLARGALRELGVATP